MSECDRRLGTFALAALLLFSLTPRPASALTLATGDPAAALYQTSKIVRIDLETGTTLSAIGVESYVNATFKLTIGTEVFGGTSGFGAWDIKLRLKGNRSFRAFPAKAALRLEFPSELQRVFGIKRMTLNNMMQDRSKINEAVGYTLFRGMGIAAPRSAASVSAKTPALETIAGSIRRGTSNIAQSSSLHELEWISKSNVRDAFDASVACTRPPVSRQIRNESTVPKSTSPRSHRPRRPGIVSSKCTIFVAEK